MSDEMKEELLPCPFCGAPADPPHKITEERQRSIWQVGCVLFCCNRRASTKSEAIKDWNTRPDSKPEQNCKSFCKLFSEAKTKEAFWQERCEICKEEAVIARKPYKYEDEFEAWCDSSQDLSGECSNFKAGFRAARVHKEG